MDENKITVAVCGDSFCSAAINDLKLVGQRAHFSQQLEDRYGYKVMHYAHGGFSNISICFQIDDAVRRKPDVIVYTTTWTSRIELVLRDNFNAASGMNNFFYYDPHAASTQEPWAGDANSNILSTVWQCIDSSPRFKISKEQKTAVDLYLKHLFNSNMEQTVHDWLFDYWHNRIIQAGILPIRFKDEDIGKIAYDFSADHRDYDTPFHTDRATQTVIADNIHRKIVDNLKQ